MRGLLGVGFEPTPPERLELESSALDRSAIQAWCWMPSAWTMTKNCSAERREEPKWSIGVSIPVPRACKARTLPIELMPRARPLRLPGIEPGSSAWEAPMITITLQALCTVPVTGVSGQGQEVKIKNKINIPGGTRTPNLLIRSQTPCPIGPQGRG